MAKTQGSIAPKPIEFPKSILVKLIRDGDEEYLSAASTPGDFEHDPDASVKTARYVLAGTGVIEHSAPLYVEHEKA